MVARLAPPGRAARGDGRRPAVRERRAALRRGRAGRRAPQPAQHDQLPAVAWPPRCRCDCPPCWSTTCRRRACAGAGACCNASTTAACAARVSVGERSSREVEQSPVCRRHSVLTVHNGVDPLAGVAPRAPLPAAPAGRHAVPAGARQGRRRAAARAGAGPGGRAPEIAGTGAARSRAARASPPSWGWPSGCGSPAGSDPAEVLGDGGRGRRCRRGDEGLPADPARGDARAASRSIATRGGQHRRGGRRRRDRAAGAPGRARPSSPARCVELAGVAGAARASGAPRPRTGAAAVHGRGDGGRATTASTGGDAEAAGG